MKNVILSKKLTFSLTSLVIMLAFGLAVYVPSAFADGDDKKNIHDIEVTIGAGETMVDVSAEDGFQIATGRDRADRAFATGPASFITLTFTFSKGTINLHTPATGTTGENALESDKDGFGLDDVFVEAFDVKGRSLGAFSVEDVTNLAADADLSATAALTSFADANNPGRVFLLRIDETQISTAYAASRGGTFEIHRLSFFMPAAVAKHDKGKRFVETHGVKNAALDHFAASFDDHEGKGHAHFNRSSNVFSVDLVDDDEGEAMYLPIASNSAAGTAPDEGTPGVVTITRILDRHAFQPIESGPFNVRIILTEEPKGGLTTDLIEVVNGSATAIRKGQSLKGAITATGLTRDSELTPNIVNYYTMADADVLAAQAGLPEATGRDNMYHQYVATITPTAGFDGDVTIAIKQFADNVLPVAKMYVPLTTSQRNATILTGTAMEARDARVKNETLMVPVHTIADAKVSAAKAAYDARQKILDADPNEITLGNKLYIPAGGYLVIVVDMGKAGIADPKSKTKEKLTAAQRLYNVFDPGDDILPGLAKNLDDFFRNGGMLTLAYADITAATGSGHGDSKGPTGDDATGYTAATTNAYAAGALIINEIMWGLDGNDTTSQYIELYNPGTAAIGIDNKEWILTTGAAPAGFTAIDTVSNNPASGYWAVPGMSGVTKVTAEFPAVSDLVSMSRVMGSTDGTAAASWIASERPSANLGGRRIGTPGAPNNPLTAPVAPPTPPPAPPPAAPVATGSDIKITEIMVASNDGRLPQWIELANVSGKEVSLMGWSVAIDNDPMDKDVVGTSAIVTLGDVTLDHNEEYGGHVALVVTKTSTRNSGVGMSKGDIRPESIIDVQSQVSPTDARYMLISEMAFKITLLPPQKGGVVEPGDVVGNLGMDWEIPMAESGRSSLIRRETDYKPKKPDHVPSKDIMGTDAAGWRLASDTDLDGAYRTTYYGDDEDVGTPGYDAGGPLPVELSKFSAARDKVTGQVMIAWETQSELNNAGFFIKRSQQRNGNFVVVNPTMIPGAGTTAEKQSYTYTDTTAQPNVVYYYQIEDVSLDGNRQTLTRGHRLKGHIGAAGKATTTWGELKTSREQ